MGLIKSYLHARIQGGCSGRLAWLRGGEGRGSLIAAMRKIQVLVTPQQPIKLSQAASPTKLAPVIAIMGTEVSLCCPGCKGWGCHPAFWHCSSCRCTCRRYNYKDGIYHCLLPRICRLQPVLGSPSSNQKCPMNSALLSISFFFFFFPPQAGEMQCLASTQFFVAR